MKEKRVCADCRHAAACNEFFARRYAQLGVKEPEAWKNWACKLWEGEKDMKKKRFLKLVMSRGVQRNEAARIAARVGEFGSYEKLYGYCRFALAFRPAMLAFRRMGKAFERAAEKQFNAFKAAFTGIDLASGVDHTVVLHHVRADGLYPSVVVVDEMAEGGAIMAMTQEEHAAAHAAGRGM